MKKELLIALAVLIIMGCGKGSSNNPGPGGSNTLPAPSKVALTFPNQNAVCTTGTIISDTLSTITFTWNVASNTDSYDLYLKNLLTSVTTTQSTNQTQLAINLLRNTPFSWYVVSKSTKSSTTTQSNVWKFYNAGKGTLSYAPFPAEIIAPTYGQSITVKAGTVNLSWKGNSVLTGTIVNYDVYLGTTSSPPITASAIVNNFLNNIPVTSNTTYYWKVITRDISGNTSDSGLYEFTVN